MWGADGLPVARWVGEHLVCNPCGGIGHALAAIHVMSVTGAGSGGVAVALAEYFLIIHSAGKIKGLPLFFVKKDAEPITMGFGCYVFY
jgi:hypothetical protein